jgi:hypothetical protein
MDANVEAMCPYTRVHLGWRDSDRDGTLDPVDTMVTETLDWRRLLRRLPGLGGLLTLLGLSPEAAASAHESVPLFMLRRVLSAEEMARVEQAITREEDQYLASLARRFESAAREIEAAQPTRTPPRQQRRRSGRRPR